MRKIVIAILLILSKIFCFGQNEFKAGSSLELMIGNRKFSVRNIGLQSTGIDFLNNFPGNTFSDLYVGFGLRKELKDKNFFSFNSSTHDDIEFINFEIAFGRFFSKNLGLEGGANVFNIPKRRGFPFDFENEYSEYRNLETIWNSDDLVFIKNFSGFVRPFYRLRNKMTILELSLKAGGGGLFKNPISYGGQSTKSYEVINVEYSAKVSPFIFVQSSFQFAFLPFQGKKSDLGFQLKGNFFPSKRQFNYDRRIDIWTAQNPIFQSFSSSKHILNRTEIEFGLIWSK